MTENTIKKKKTNKNWTAEAGVCTSSENDEGRARGYMANNAAGEFSTPPGF